jgi:hypothetical protein
MAAVALPAWWAARCVRRRSLTAWDGGVARLAESVIAIAIVMAVCQLVGAVGLFDRWIVIAGVLVLSLVLVAWGSRGSGAPADPAHTSVKAEDRGGRTGALAAVTAVALVVGRWSTFTIESLRSGVLAADSIWYHLPRAARFAQSGWVTRLHYTAPEFPDTFHPANVELVQGLSMLMYQRDVLSGVLNLGWLALLLLAAWCIGQPFGHGSLSLTGVAALLATPLLVLEGAGNAGNDIAASFFLLAAVALLLQPQGGNAAVAVAAIAAGMAISTKLTVVPAVLVITVGVLCTRGAGERVRRALAWSLPLIAFGTYWYIRNWVAVGTPLPATHLPFFPSPSFRIADELGFSVFDYLTDVSVWREWFLPGLWHDFGWAWPLLVLVLVVASVGALRAGRGALMRSVGASLLVATAAYVVLPTTALGEAGAPVLFAGNVIYLAPALLLSLALLPTLWPPEDRRVSGAVLCAYLVVLVAGSTTSDISVWASGWLVVGLGVTAVVWLAGLWVVRSQPSGRLLWLAGGSTLVVLMVLLGAAADRGDVHRYADQRFYRWANDVTDARIAVAGFTGQFPFYGARLENLVQYVGEAGPHGEFHDVGSCRSWRRRLRTGGFDYVVLRSERSETDTRQLVWTRTDPAATLWFEAEGGAVFRFDPSIADPGCT